MKTSIVLDDDLIEEARGVTGLKTKRDVVHEALRFLIASKKRSKLFELEGQIRFHPGYDYKALRKDR